MANAKTYRTSRMPIPPPHCFGDTERSKLKRRSRLPYPATMLGISSLWPEWEHYDAPAPRISFMTHAAPHKLLLVSSCLRMEKMTFCGGWRLFPPAILRTRQHIQGSLAYKPIPVSNLDAAAMQSVKSTPPLQCLLFAAVNVAFTSSSARSYQSRP